MPDAPCAAAKPIDMLVISRIEDLDRLRDRPRGRVSLSLAGTRLSEPERRRIERRIERQLGACGCNEGTMSGLIYLVSAVVLGATGCLPLGSFAAWAGLVAGFLAALMAGKIFGLGLARLRLRRAIDRLKPLITESARHV